MIKKALKNGKTKFLHRQSWYLSSPLKRTQSTQNGCRRFRHIVPNDLRKSTTRAYNLEKNITLVYIFKIAQNSKIY